MVCPNHLLTVEKISDVFGLSKIEPISILNCLNSKKVTKWPNVFHCKIFLQSIDKSHDAIFMGTRDNDVVNINKNKNVS